MKNFQERINYQGDLKPLLQKVSIDFEIGEYISHSLIPIGYEDLNIAIITSRGTYFVKIFEKLRDRKNCNRYIEIITKILKAGASHPLLYKSSQGFLYEINMDNSIDRLCIMEFIDGKNFQDMQIGPSPDEMKFIIKQAALINRINYDVPLIYDSWSPTNFLNEFEKRKDKLTEDEFDLISPLAENFKALPIDSLPHCLVHGDIIKQNVLRDVHGKIYIIDFSVTNYYPRIHELAVLLSDLFFDPKKLESFENTYKFVIEEYQKYIPLKNTELELLPKYIKISFAMFFLRASYEKRVNKNDSAENNHLLSIGRIGIQKTIKNYL